ncbi:MAG: hypothetical protein ACI9YT_002827, partial [Halobacteriales archaeon]
MTDEIPPERQCPVCGELNVNPHPDSLCPEHHPAEDLDVTPLEDTTKPTPDPTLAEVRAVAEQEATPDRDRQDDVVDDLSPTATPDQPATDAGDDSGSFLAAALGDPDATEAHGSDDTDVQDTTPSSAGGVGMPTGALPLGQLDALDPRERRRAAKKRGLDWPTTDEARDRLEETVHDVLRHEDDRVIDAPTSLGKT